MKVSMHNIAMLAVLSGALAVSPPVAAVATETETSSSSNADYVLGAEAAKAREWDRAAYHLAIAAEAEPNNPDVQNLLGSTFRNQRKYELAFAHYRQALKLAPNHRGAHEYIGEAYVLTGNGAKAMEHLVALERICGKNCEEYQDLARALATPR